MSDFGLFEVTAAEDSAPDVQQRVASRRLESAIYDVHQVYGRFLLGATGLDEFEDRWHYSKQDIRRTVEPHLMPVTGVMRRVHDAMKKAWKEAIRKEAPFAGYKDFAACVAANQDKGDPEAYCGSIKHKVEDKKSSRTAALDDAPDMDLDETFHPSEGNLIPQDNWEGYKDSVDQGGPEKVEGHDFGSGGDTGSDKPHEGRRLRSRSDAQDSECPTCGADSGESCHDDDGNAMQSYHKRRRSFVIDLYTDWARSNGLRVASTSTLILYSPNCTDAEYRQIHAAIKRAGDEDEDEDREREDEDKEREDEDREREDEDKEDDDGDHDEDSGDDEDDDEGDDEGDEDKDDDKDDAPPWLTGARNYLADVGQAPDEDPEDDEQSEGASEPPAQDPSAAPPAPGGDMAPQAPPPDQPPVDASQPPAPLENQPAEDHLLDTANDAVSQMIDRETQEYQQLIDPLTQALQAIEYAQSVEQQANPLDVTPPDGTVDVGPQDAATGAPQPDLSQQGPPQMTGRRHAIRDPRGRDQSRDWAFETLGESDQGQSDEELERRLHEEMSRDPDYWGKESRQLQQQAYRIARHFGMTKSGYRMLLEAMGRRHYQTVADAIAGLPVEHRGPIAASLGDMFAAENPRFRHDPFFAAAGVDPRTISASRLGFNRLAVPGDKPWGPLQGPVEVPFRDAPALQKRYMEDPDAMDWDSYIQRQHDDPSRKYGPELGPYHPGSDLPPRVLKDMDMGRYDDINRQWAQDEALRTSGVSWNETKNAPLAEHERYDLDPANWQGDDEQSHWENDPAYRDYMGLGEREPYSWNVPPDAPYTSESKSFGQPGQPNRWGQRQADAGTLTPGEVMDSFEFPNANKTPHPKDNLSVTPDTIGTPAGLTKPKMSALDIEAKGVMDLWNQNVRQRSQKGLVTDPEPAFSDFAEKVKDKVSPGALDKVKQKVVPGTTPSTTSPVTPAAPKTKAAFFTRRVPGWSWDDHLAAYTATSAAPFTCACGSMFDVPSYYNCRCGKVFNAYPIGSGGDDRTASVDMYLCREIQVRPDMIMASRHTACNCGHDPCTCEDVEWVTDEDRKDADAPHAPGKTAGWTEHPEGGWTHPSGGALRPEGEGMYQMYGPTVTMGGPPGEAKLRQPTRDPQAAMDWYSWTEGEGPKPPGTGFFGRRAAAEHDPSRWNGPYGDENTTPEEYAGMARAMDEHFRKQRVRQDIRDALGDPYRQAAIGEDDHSVVTRDGDKYCSKCDALLWDPNVHHCPAKQATRTMFGDWTKYDDDLDYGGPATAPSTDVRRPPPDWARRDEKSRWIGPAIPPKPVLG